MNPQINPLFFNYGTDTSAVEVVAKPSAIIVTGRGNRYDDAFQRGRKKGAMVQAYWNPFNIPVGTKNPEDLEQWMGDAAKVPRWRFNGTGPIRSNWSGTELADIRPGSAWRKFFRQISESLIRRALFDGFFLDTLGARPWAAGWDSWPLAEQKLWTECAVDVMRELHELRAGINPDFELIANNLWFLPPAHPAAATAKLGDQYCNGVCLENPPPDQSTGSRAAFHVNYAARSFAGGRYPRRLLIVAQNQKLFDEWKADDNITHISLVDQKAGQNYMKPTPAMVPYHDLGTGLGQSECEKQVEELQAALDALHQENDELKKINVDLSIANTDLVERISKIQSHAAEIAKLALG